MKYEQHLIEKTNVLISKRITTPGTVYHFGGGYTGEWRKDEKYGFPIFDTPMQSEWPITAVGSFDFNENFDKIITECRDFVEIMAKKETN